MAWHEVQLPNPKTKDIIRYIRKRIEDENDL